MSNASLEYTLFSIFDKQKNLIRTEQTPNQPKLIAQNVKEILKQNYDFCFILILKNLLEIFKTLQVSSTHRDKDGFQA